MKEIRLTLSEAEIKSVATFIPMLDKVRHLIPAGLLSIVHKVEEQINGN